MTELTFTPAQREAIETRDRAVLVSAAAGSGKTRVLTERVMARVAAGEDIDRFLIITFTRAAAAELRARILARLNALCAERPSDRRLRRQGALLYRAQIGTIDSFCTAVVRQNAHLLGVSPDFSILEEDRGAQLRERALEQVLDRAYETIGENAGLRALVDSAGAGRDDARLAALVLSLYDRLQSQADAEGWAAGALSALDVTGLTDAGGTAWGRYLLDDAAGRAAYHARALEDALALMAGPENAPLMKGYGPSFTDAAAWLRALGRACRDGWDAAAAALEGPWPRLGVVRSFSDEARKARVRAVWDEAREAVKKLKKSLAGSSAALLEGIERSRPALTALMELVFALEREYAARKRRAGVCDFSDVEHLALRLLGADGPTALAQALSGRFAEVMVDEYQDINAVQERIFQRVSGEGARLFMVGDVKQSIYRFRLAEPSIFLEKYAAFAERDDARRVLLRENFRSRGAVLDACNAVFSRIMSPALGELEYGDEARLVRGADYPPEGETRPELCLIDPGAPDDEPTPDTTRAEAVYVARRIRDMVARGERVSDGRGGTRPVGYGDIAILLRAPGSCGAAYRRALVEECVPVSARQGGAFFSRPEVDFCLSMLAVADNPRQDVPLIAALRGLPFGFTPDELAAVRAGAEGDLWDGLRARAGEDERCARFVAVVERLRDLAREEPVEGLLRRLYDETGLMALCAALPDGPSRQAELMQLYEYARRFEQGGERGLFRFTAWLRQLSERGSEPAAAEDKNAVQLMSIHRSKGLEFPVVFLSDLSRRWGGGAAGAVLCHGRLGLGMRLTDAERGVDFPTLPWRAIARRQKLEELSEQERVLYVAMTRAREKLIMTCVQAKAEERLDALRPLAEGGLDPYMLAEAPNPARWLMAAALCDGGETIDLRVIRPEGETPPPEASALPRGAARPEDVDTLRARLAWTYPQAGAVTLPSKLTATGLGRLGERPDPESMDLDALGAARPRRFRTPDLGPAGAPLTGAERGTAAHLVMQHIDLAHTGSADEIAAELERLERLGFLDGRQARAVLPGDILAFFRSALGRRVLAAERVMREFRFSLLCPAGTWFPGAPAGEEVLLQGVVDCCIEEAGALTIIDFKTDARLEPERYAAQLSAYAMAMERVTQKPVREKALWYLRKNRAVTLP